MKNRPTKTLSLCMVLGASLALLAASCSDDSSGTSSGATEDAPTIVVTTNILGDVVENMVGDLATVETIMPEGSDPHEFQASAQQANSMREGAVLVTNGADFEEGLLATIEGAEADGVPICAAIDSVDTIEIGSGGHADEDHGDEEHEHSGTDPHFFTDPARMAVAVAGLADCIVDAAPELDNEEFRAQTAAYIEELEALDAEVEATLDAVSEESRILVTNHEVFGYFADRYGFEVAGAILPSSTQAEADAAEIAALAELLEAEGVQVVFAETSSPEQVAEALAAEAGDVEVVTLFSESLGPDGGETYVDMIRTNASRIADALS